MREYKGVLPRWLELVGVSWRCKQMRPKRKILKARDYTAIYITAINNAIYILGIHNGDIKWS